MGVIRFGGNKLGRVGLHGRGVSGEGDLSATGWGVPELKVVDQIETRTHDYPPCARWSRACRIYAICQPGHLTAGPASSKPLTNLPLPFTASLSFSRRCFTAFRAPPPKSLCPSWLSLVGDGVWWSCWLNQALAKYWTDVTDHDCVYASKWFDLQFVSDWGKSLGHIYWIQEIKELFWFRPVLNHPEHPSNCTSIC